MLEVESNRRFHERHCKSPGGMYRLGGGAWVRHVSGLSRMEEQTIIQKMTVQVPLGGSVGCLGRRCHPDHVPDSQPPAVCPHDASQKGPHGAWSVTLWQSKFLVPPRFPGEGLAVMLMRQLGTVHHSILG